VAELDDAGLDQICTLSKINDGMAEEIQCLRQILSSIEHENLSLRFQLDQAQTELLCTKKELSTAKNKDTNLKLKLGVMNLAPVASKNPANLTNLSANPNLVPSSSTAGQKTSTAATAGKTPGQELFEKVRSAVLGSASQGIKISPPPQALARRRKPLAPPVPSRNPATGISSTKKN